VHFGWWLYASGQNFKFAYTKRDVANAMALLVYLLKPGTPTCSGRTVAIVSLRFLANAHFESHSCRDIGGK
jgi:hypothetical protein